MASLGKCMKIRHIVRLRQIVRKWRKVASARKAAQKLLDSCPCISKMGNSGKSAAASVPEDVPSGHLAVYVGQHCTSRFVIRAAYLNHPVFRALLEQAEEEFGFSRPGGLAIPCDELLFEHVLRLFGSQDPKSIRHLDLEDLKNNFCCSGDWNCSSGAAKVGSAAVAAAATSPLIHVFAEKSIG